MCDVDIVGVVEDGAGNVRRLSPMGACAMFELLNLVNIQALTEPSMLLPLCVRFSPIRLADCDWG